MWHGEYRTETDVSAQRLFDTILDINHWPSWDAGLEATRLTAPVAAGASFTLKPKGGPTVKMTVDTVKPFLFVDTAHLFLAKMRTTHEYTDRGAETAIRFTVEVWGPLGFFWRRVVGENQIREAPAQMSSFIEYARKKIQRDVHSDIPVA